MIKKANMLAKFGVSCGGDLWSADDIRAVEELNSTPFGRASTSSITVPFLNR